MLSLNSLNQTSLNGQKDPELIFSLALENTEQRNPDAEAHSDGPTKHQDGTTDVREEEPLTGNNFKEWYESFNVHMTLHNLDLPLRVDEPRKPIDVSFADEKNTIDKCIYLRVIGSRYIFLVLYVDDILLASDLLIETKHMLSTNFDMKDLGEASYVLGIKILRDRANEVVKLSQRTYIEKILKRFNMHNCSSNRAPIVKGDKFSKAQSAKKVLRYLQGTKDLMLTYQRTNILHVVGFCDADFAGCIYDKKSTTGYIFVMEGGAVSWKSVKQTLTTSSTMEGEYVACYEACSLGVVDSISRALKLFYDNFAAVAFSKNTRSTSHSKHIDVKFYFVKEKVAESLINIEHMSTKGITERAYGDGRKTCWKEAGFAQIETGCVLGMELDSSDSPHAMRRRLQLALMFSLKIALNAHMP
ncbi:hypothetical protein AAG906_003177 [Vitis piasezkii]